MQQHEFSVATLVTLRPEVLRGLARHVRALLGPCTVDQALTALRMLQEAGQPADQITLHAQLADDRDLRKLAEIGLRRLQWTVRPDLDLAATARMARRRARAAELGIAIVQRGVDSATVTFDGDAAEVKGLGLGLRTAWRLRVPEGELLAFGAACQSAGLVSVATARPWSAAVGGLLKPATTGAHLVVVAHELARAQACLDDEIALHQLHGRSEPQGQRRQMVAAHRRLGAAYGFPQCCIEAFVDAFCEVVATGRTADNPLAVARAARRSKRFEPLLYTLVADLGHAPPTPLRHMPCRFDCSDSLALADRLGAVPVADPVNVVLVAGGAYVQCGGVAALRGTEWRITDAPFVQTYGFIDDPRSRPRWQAVFDLRHLAIRVTPGYGFRVRIGQRWQSFLADPDQAGGSLFPVVLPFRGGRTSLMPPDSATVC